MEKWQDARELLRLASRVYVEPYIHDILVKIGPALVLILGWLTVRQGFTFTKDLIWGTWDLGRFVDWILLLVVLVVSWVIGSALVKLSSKLHYARPLQPHGWCKYIWLEAVEDFEGRASLMLRRIASSQATVSLIAAGSGIACAILLLVAILQFPTLSAWVLLSLLLVTVALLAVYHVLETKAVLIAAGILGIVSFIVALTLPGWWPAVLLASVLILWIIHTLFRKMWQQSVLSFVPGPEAVAIRPRLVPGYLGPQGSTAEDESYEGSRYQEVHNAIWQNPYYAVLG